MVEIQEDARIPNGTMIFASKPRYTIDYHDGQFWFVSESFEQWAKRCFVITGIGTEK